MAHIAKYQAAALGGMLAHYARTPELKHGYRRDNIDPARTTLNYNLAPAHPCGQVDFINDRIASLGLKRKVRKDAIRMCDCVLTMPKSLDPSREREFFEDAYAFLANRYGAENVVSAYVHMDESMPHMHFAWVPVTEDGRLSAKDVVTRSELRTLHTDLQKSLEKAMGCQVDVLIPEDRRQEKAAKYVGLAEFKAASAAAQKARDGAAAAVAQEKTAKAEAERAEVAQKAAESRKRDSEAAAEAAEKDLETQRRRAGQLGPDGEGINWHYPDGHVEHESSVGEVRAARDAEERLRSVAIKQRETAEADAMSAKLDAASARSEAEAWQAMVRDVQGISYKDEDGHERMGIKGMEQAYAAAQERLKAAQAAETVAVQQAQKAQDAAQGTEQHLAHAKADLQKSLAEAARAKQERDRYARERLIDWTEIDSAIAEVARYVATVVVSLWDSARNFAVSVWQSWRGEWGRAITAKVGYSAQYHDELSVEKMAEVCEEQRRPDIAHALGVDEEREERGYDDWER